MNILVLHNVEDLRKTRRAILDYLFCFQRYQPQHNYFYHCISHPVSDALRDTAWNAVILDSTALGICTFRPRELFHAAKERWSFLADERIVKVVFPQDDANHGGLMDDWFEEWGVQHVYSVRPEHKDVLYPRSSKSASFHFCLAGYIDDRSLPHVHRFAKPWPERTRLLGQRVTMYPPRGGRQGRLKGVVAETMRAVARDAGLAAVDISTDPKDVLMGDAWWRFLGDCKFVLGTEGGLSLFDPYGEIHDRIEAFLQTSPGASFDDVEAACFPGLDGVHMFPGFSPRILEAAMCEASQILVEGRYLDVLEPGVHYLALKPDCSNAADVFDAMKDEHAAQNRVRACLETLVENPLFRFSTLAERVIKTIHDTRDGHGPSVAPPKPGALRRALTEALITQYRDVGFRWAHLANRMASIAAAQTAEPLVASNESDGTATELAGQAAAARALSSESARIASTAAAGALGSVVALVQQTLGSLADLTAATADVALAVSAGDRPEVAGGEIASARTAISAALARAEAAARELEHAAGFGVGVAGLLQIAGVPHERALTIEAIIGSEIDPANPGLDDAALARGAQIMRLLHAGGRRAEILSALAHDVPDDIWKVLDALAPPSTTKGSWAIDDRARAEHVDALLRGAPPDSELGRLTLALAAGGLGAVGLVSRLKPSSGATFSEEEARRAAAVDALLVLTDGDPEALESLAKVFQARKGVGEPTEAGVKFLRHQFPE